jgi:N-acyl homoserine lactone hydrolase
MAARLKAPKGALSCYGYWKLSPGHLLSVGRPGFALADLTASMEPDDIRRFVLGHYTMPQDSSLPGQKIVVVAYLVRHADGLLLFDTGIGEGHQEVERRYHPIRRYSLEAGLAGVGAAVSDVTEVVNCHFHLDHCGGNPRFPRTPIFAQQAEYDASGSLDYTLPQLVDFAEAKLELHDGEADVARGIRIIPTPGHTPGHQSLFVQTTRGPIVIAGQATNDASEYGRARMAWEVAKTMGEEAPEFPPWVAKFAELEPHKVFFAHDLAVWEQIPSGLE